MTTGSTQSVRINFRTDTETKRLSEELFHALGLDMSSALNMFLKQAIREQQLPIHPSLLLIPNAQTAQAISHTQAILDRKIPDDVIGFNNADDAVDFLNNLS